MTIREESKSPRTGGGEDRLSAILALTLVGANVAGVGMFGLLKVLDIPPLVASSESVEPMATIQPPTGSDRMNGAGSPIRDLSRLRNPGPILR